MTLADLHEVVTRAARRAYDDPHCHPNWEVAAADQVIVKPFLRDVFAALTYLRALHQPRSWHTTSDVVVCIECQKAWPCDTVKVLT